jgi:hypothetical protein
MKFCEQCGAQLGNDMAFCSECGKTAGAPTAIAPLPPQGAFEPAGMPAAAAPVDDFAGLSEQWRQRFSAIDVPAPHPRIPFVRRAPLAHSAASFPAARTVIVSR